MPNNRLTGEIPTEKSLNGKLNNAIEYVYPELEDLEVTPKTEEQHFKSNKYGYNEVTIKPIEAEELSVTPKEREQVFNGMYNKVNVTGDSDLIPENIKEGIEIFGVEGLMKAESKPNIFLQEEEPATKEGIWLQASGLEYDKILMETLIKAEEYWENDDFATLAIGNFSYGNVVNIGADIYIITRYTPSIWRFNIETKELVKLASAPMTNEYFNCVIRDTNIYIFYADTTNTTSSITKVTKFDILTNEFTEMASINLPLIAGNKSICIVGNRVYLDTNSATKLGIYDLDTQTYTTSASVVCNNPRAIVAVGTDIYILGTYYDTNYNASYKYDTLTNTYKRIADTPNKNKIAYALSFGTDIYLFGMQNTTNVYKYSTLQNTYTELSKAPITLPATNYPPGILVGNYVYMFYDNTKIKRMCLEPIEYPDKSILLLRGRNGYETQLVDSDIEGRNPNYIIDAWYYTKSSNLNKMLPTYYGNGTEWIKFKNV